MTFVTTVPTGVNEPYLRAWVVHGLAELIEDLGGDPAIYERRFHLSLQRSNQANAVIPAGPILRLMETVARDLSCPDFGIRAGLAQGQGAVGPVMVASLNCETVREAYASGFRYLNGLFSAFTIDLVETEDGPRSVYTLKIPHVRVSRQFQEWNLAITTKILPILAGPEARLRGVYFSHQPLLEPAFYENVFGCPVSFGQPGYGVEYRTEDLERPIPSNSPELRAVISEYLDRIIASSGLGLEHQTLALIHELLPTGACNLGVIADHHFVTVRTMQRRLAAEGLVFERLVDDARREQAFDYLADPERTISQIAGLLGYAEHSSFTHAFRRWSGTSPSAWRAMRTPEK